MVDRPGCRRHRRCLRRRLGHSKALIGAAGGPGYSDRSTTAASGALFFTDSTPPNAAALVL